MQYAIFVFCLIIQLTLLAEEQMNGMKEACPKLTGRIVLPDSDQYEKARLVSNYYPSKDRHPKVIVYCQNAQDVQNAVKWANCNNIPIRVRSGGHNHEGFSTGDDAIVIDVSEMKNIEIDKSKNIATLGPGITGGELYALLAKEKLTQVGGTCADVGISGLILTGGMGPLVRLHGLSCDSLVSFEMVNAKGEIIQVTPDNEYRDLFWAACGAGGGNFGVVTSLVLRVYPSKPVTWFNIGWNWDQPIDKVIAGWQDFYIKGDNRRFSHLDLWGKAFPSDKFKKQPVKAMGIYYGTPEEAKKELAPLLSIGKPTDQVIEQVEWEKAVYHFADATSTFITDKPEYKSSGTFVMKPLPPEAIAILVATLRNSKSPLINVLFLGLGGAAKNKTSTETAYYYRGAEYFASYSTQWLEGKDADKLVAEVDSLRKKLLPYTQGDYVGNPDRNLKDYLTDYFGGNVQRLKCIKKKYDPKNLFRYEQSIPPATEECKG